MHRLMHGACIHLFLQDAFVCFPTQSGRWIKTQRSSNISIARSEESAEGRVQPDLHSTFVFYTHCCEATAKSPANKIHSLYVRRVLLK